MTRSRGRRNRPGYHGPVIEGEPVGRGQGPVITRGVGAYSIGDISGPTSEPIEVEFVYFGEKIRVNPEMTEIDMIDFLDKAEHVKADDPKSMLMVKEAARDHIHPADFDRFWELRKANRQGVQQLMATIWQIIAGTTGRPTGRRSDSSDGPPDTSRKSPGTSSAPDIDQYDPQSELRDRYLKQIERFEAQGTPMGVAMAAQIATAAESRGVKLDDRLATSTG